MLNRYFRFLLLLYFFSSTALANVCENINDNLSSLAPLEKQQIQGVQAMVLVNHDLYILLRKGAVDSDALTTLMRMNINDNKGVQWVPNVLSVFEQLPIEQVSGMSLVPQGITKDQTLFFPLFYGQGQSTNLSIQGLQEGDLVFLLNRTRQGQPQQALSIYRTQGGNTQFQWLHSQWNTKQLKIVIDSEQPGKEVILASELPQIDALGMTIIQLQSGWKILNTTASSIFNANNSSQVAYNIYDSDALNEPIFIDVKPWLKYGDDQITALAISANAKNILIAGRSVNPSTHEGEVRLQCIPQNSPFISSQLGDGTQPKIETRKQALRLLRQSAFTSKEVDIDFIRRRGDEAWLLKQLALPSDLEVISTEPVGSGVKKQGHLKSVLQFLNNVTPTRYPEAVINDPYTHLEEKEDKDRFKIFSRSVWWQKALHNEDQLRQRVAYALSQLLVVSNISPAGRALESRGEALAHYYDILIKHAFGNYRDLLKEVTLSSTMGYYLTYVGNKKALGSSAPDENYARELMQLFTIGLYELNLDGTQKIVNGKAIPTYTQDDVSELSKVFTGWDWQERAGGTANYGSTAYLTRHSLTVPLEFTSIYHDFGAKNVLGHPIVAGLSGEADIDAALNILFSHPNIAPHVSKHLIMRLVTSNPTPAYVKRVATIFNNNGEGVKGDLKATVKAVLMDAEARDPASRKLALQEQGIANPNLTADDLRDNFGKVDEFLLATTHFLSSFNVSPLSSWDYWSEKTSDKRVPVANTYWFNPTFYYPQLPLKAESVFNFYSADFIPSDPYFVNKQLAAPELQIRNNNNLLGFSGLIYSLIFYEKYRLIDLEGAGSMAKWAKDHRKRKLHRDNLYIDLTGVFRFFEQQLDGDNNGDFINMPDIARKTTAINNLISYLDLRLLGGTMPMDYKMQLRDHLLAITTVHSINKAKYIISVAIRAIVTSPLYLVLD